MSLPLMTVGLAGGDLRSEYGAAAPPESYPRIPQDSGLQLSGGLHAVGDGDDLGDVDFEAEDLESRGEVEAQQPASLEGLDSRPPSVWRPAAEAACRG